MTNDHEIVLTRLINAPRERVWQAWTDPAQLNEWWGPNGFTTTTHEIDVREGGVWRFTMHGPDGVDYPNRIVYQELVEPERIAFIHDSDGTSDDPAFHSEVTFEDQDTQTLVTLRNVFASAAERDRVIEEYGAIEGGKQTLGRLADFVEL